jgi:hypothetical protein
VRRSTPATQHVTSVTPSRANCSSKNGSAFRKPTELESRLIPELVVDSAEWKIIFEVEREYASHMHAPVRLPFRPTIILILQARRYTVAGCVQRVVQLLLLWSRRGEGCGNGLQECSCYGLRHDQVGGGDRLCRRAGCVRFRCQISIR